MNLPAPPTNTFGARGELLSLDEAALGRAYEPSAYGGYYADDERRPKPYRIVGAVAIIDVLGALDTRAGWWWDGYDAIVARDALAHADPAVQAVVHAYDSPGGMCAGNLDAAQSLRRHADASGKPVVAHAGTTAASAAYALACAADRILVTADGAVGSIGVIAEVYSRNAANEKVGLDVRVVRSGNLKCDPHPDVALTDASVARVRTRVNELAGMFAAQVAARRPQIGDPLALQGACVYGADAVAKGLADEVGTLADAVTLAARLAVASTTTRKNMDINAKAAATLASLRSAAQVETDEELLAHLATQGKAAAKVPDLTRERDEARAELKRRDEEGTAKAREAVLQKHRDRGALSEADEKDEAYMASLAGLTPEQLDANLSRLPGVTTPTTKAVAAGSTGTGTQAARGSVGAKGAITPDEQKIARGAGLTDDEYIAARDGKETSR